MVVVEELWLDAKHNAIDKNHVYIVVLLMCQEMKHIVFHTPFLFDKHTR